MKLSIIIPVYNEESTLKEILTRVKAANLGKISKEIIVVDDFSSDNSFSIAKKFKGTIVFKHKQNLGKGAAVRTGIRNATGDILIIQDADLEYDPKFYKKLLAPLINKKACVVYGTRLKNLPLRLWGRQRTPFLAHYFGNTFLTFITNILYGSNITDMETCYKLLKTDLAKSLKLKSNKFEIEPEITAKLLKRRIKIYEVPIKVIPRGYAEGKKITWKDGFGALQTLIKYRFTE